LTTDQRSEKDIWTLYESFKDNKFFRQYINNTDERERLNALLYLCKKLKYETWGPQRIIIKQGEYSNGKVYIVLSGELNVYIKNAEKADDNPSRNDISISAATEHEEIQSTIMPNKKVVMNSIFSVVAAVKSKKMSRNAKKGEQLSFSEESRNSSRRNSINIKSSNNPSLDLSKMVLKRGGITSAMKNALSKQGAFVEKENLSDYGVIVGQLEKGDHFGEKALFRTHKRSASVITINEVELLVLDRETFKHVQYEFERMKHLITEFLKVTMPCMEKVSALQVLESLMYVCDVRDFPYHKTLANEGQPAEDFFLVYEGRCELTKTIIYDNSECSKIPTSEVKSLYGLKKTKKEEIVVSNVEKGSFIAEEICFPEKVVYHYTARVSSNRAKIICFKKNMFLFRCPKVIQIGIQQIFSHKKDRFTKILLEKLEKKGITSNFEALSGIKPIVFLSQNSNSYVSNIHQSLSPSQSQKLVEKTKSTKELENFEKKSPLRREEKIQGFLFENENGLELNHSIILDPKSKSQRQEIKKKNSLSQSLAIRDFFSSPQSSINLNKPLLSERISSQKTLKQRPSSNSIENVDLQETEIQKISHTKFDFGPRHRELKRKSKEIEAKKKIESKNALQFNSPPSLADFVTYRLREYHTQSEPFLEDKNRTSIKIENNLNIFNASKNDRKVSMPSLNFEILKSPLTSPLSSPRIKTAFASPRANLGLSLSLSKFQSVNISPFNGQSVINLCEYPQSESLTQKRKSAKFNLEEKEIVNIHVPQKPTSASKRPFSSLNAKRKQRKF